MKCVHGHKHNRKHTKTEGTDKNIMLRAPPYNVTSREFNTYVDC